MARFAGSGPQPPDSTPAARLKKFAPLALLYSNLRQVSGEDSTGQQNF